MHQVSKNFLPPLSSLLVGWTCSRILVQPVVISILVAFLPSPTAPAILTFDPRHQRSRSPSACLRVYMQWPLNAQVHLYLLLAVAPLDSNSNATPNISANLRFVMSHRCPNLASTPTARCRWSCDVGRLRFWFLLLFSAQAWPEQRRSDSSNNREPFWPKKQTKQNKTEREKQSLAGLQSCLSAVSPASIMLQQQTWLTLAHILKPTGSAKLKASFASARENISVHLSVLQQGKRKKNQASFFLQQVSHSKKSRPPSPKHT